jgi:hypothetical protein
MDGWPGQTGAQNTLPLWRASVAGRGPGMAAAAGPAGPGLPVACAVTGAGRGRPG